MKNANKIFNNIRIILLILFIIGISNAVVDVCFTKLEKVTIFSNKIAAGKSVKLLQISDVHNKRSVNSNKQLQQLVKRAQPDIVVITGDLIDDNTKSLQNVYELVEAIAAINPRIYFVTGNHEWRGGLAGELKKGLAARGVVVMDNQNAIVNTTNSSINLCGVADWTSGEMDLNSALQGVDDKIYTVMLAHDPWIIYDYEDFVPDLTLSGHTHGGQVRLPFVGAVVAPGQKLFPDLDKGLYNMKQNKLLYIDSGVGTSVFPIRFLNRSQVTLITIE
ncbi:MAG: putative phosphohydrolase [Clostridia bacterium]|nr:putative phosphohydrolase [Clostridia bacterium]